jgi:acyl-CoA synthetase (AMP-forming)/AMP-acid ligase II/acyl carrier protein
MTVHNFAAQSTLHGLIANDEKQASANPAILVPGKKPITYDGLKDIICNVANVLSDIGIQRQDRVALVLPNGQEMATGFLACAYAATCAPLNPNYSATEFEFYLQDIQAKALIVDQGTDSPVREVANRLGIQILEAGLSEVDGSFFPDRETASLDKPLTLPQPSQIALILHTSGTTSRPKIVPLSHANLMASAGNIVNSLALTAQDRCLSVMPLFHIHGLVAGLIAPLLAGGQVICPAGFDVQSFFRWLETFSPTWYTAVPTMHQALLAESYRHKVIISKHPLRFIRSSSSALPPTVLSALEQTFKVPVIEAYGMTEAAHQMASNPLPPLSRKAGSVGQPAGPEITIMYEQGNFLPDGKTGEVVIRGTNVTSGYENNPKANQSAFTDGWFRTGDQGRFDENGYLFLTGRLKEIINRGGEKISPREIDEALLVHPQVAQAVAFAIPHPTLGEDIAAAVVLVENSVLTSLSLRDFLFESLADFKMPSKIILLDTIPKGPTGKIQRITLASKLTEQLHEPYAAPRNALETVVTDFFVEVLGIESIGIHANFFLSGGDSLKGTQLMSRVNELFGLNLAVPSIFHKPTIAELTDFITSQFSTSELEDISSMINEISTFSDEEATHLLDK